MKNTNRSNIKPAESTLRDCISRAVRENVRFVNYKTGLRNRIYLMRRVLSSAKCTVRFVLFHDTRSPDIISPVSFSLQQLNFRFASMLPSRK